MSPTYTPALDKNVGVNRDNLITSYFLQGYTNAEIASFLALHHGIILSVRTVKRILKHLRLRRAKRNNESPLEQIVSVILEELEKFVWFVHGLSSTYETPKTEV